MSADEKNISSFTTWLGMTYGFLVAAAFHMTVGDAVLTSVLTLVFLLGLATVRILREEHG